ncbi:unnamed protein product [Parajaminaea phylloscopi]
MSATAYSPLGHRGGGAASAAGRLITHGPPLLATLFLVASFVLSILPASRVAPAEVLGQAATAPVDAAQQSQPAHVLNSTGVIPLPVELRSALTLPQTVCRAEFPLLYPQLEELKSHWKQRGGIQKADVDRLEKAAASQDRWAWARVIIKDGRLWIRSYRNGADTRQRALLALLNNAIVSDPAFASGIQNSTGTSDLLPPVDIVMSTGDRDGFPGYDEGPGWVLTKRIKDAKAVGTWLTPDFGFLGWPEAQSPTYPEVVDLQRKEEEMWQWQRKDDRAFWRGFPNYYPIRKDLMERTREASHLPAGHEDAWADVFATTFGGETGPEYRPLVKLEEHCRRKYLIHSEGNSYSGRSKYLFSCRSITIAHPLEWTQHFHPALISDPNNPKQNYIELKGPGFDGLEETVRGLWESDGRQSGSQGWWAKAKAKGVLGDRSAIQIADNARDSLRDRYLTPAATACYWRAALEAYSQAQQASSWTASNPLNSAGGTVEGPWITPGNGASQGHMLGSAGAIGDISYESWNLVGGGDWPAPASKP